jgi:hypothetical protein
MRIRLILATTVLLIGFVGGWLSAQSIMTAPVNPPVVLSGGNIGFRVEGLSGNVAVGSLVVQVNGQWVNTDFARGVNRLTTR